MLSKSQHIHTSFAVVGAGFAAFFAAIAAARHGVKTVLVLTDERADFTVAPSQSRETGLLEEFSLRLLCRPDVKAEGILLAMAQAEENLTVHRCEEIAVETNDRCITSVTADGAKIVADLFADCTKAGILGCTVGESNRQREDYLIPESEAPADTAAFFADPETDMPVGISYRYLLSEKADNLFLAEDKGAALGQAIGTAAAISVKHKKTPAEIGRTHIEELRETLQYDDCFLPYCRRDVSEAALDAELGCDDAVSGDILNLRTGIDRCHMIYGEGDQGFTMAVGATIEYHMDEPYEVTRTRIVFDSDPDRASETGMPKTLAKVYALEIETENGWEGILFENENTRRVITAAICRSVTGIRLTVMETWGDAGVHLLSFDFE